MPDGRLGGEPGETAGTGPGAEPPRRAARIESLRRAVEQGDSAAGERALIATRPAEVADAIESLPPELRSRLWRWLAPEARGEVLVEVGSDVRRQLIDEASAVELVAAMQRLQLDEIADLDADLPPAVLEAVVRSMDARRRERYERVRS